MNSSLRSWISYCKTPTPKEINVKRVYEMRYAEEQGQEKFQAVFTNLNDEMAKQAAR